MSRSILFLCLSLCFCTPIFAQNGAYWQTARAPQGFFGNVEHFNGDTCFAIYALNGSLKHLYRSTDKGENWQEIIVSDPEPQLQGTRNMFVGEAGHLFLLIQGKLYRALADAQNWTLINANAPVTILEEGPGGILIGIGSAKIHRSTDGGITWDIVYGSGTVSSVNTLTYWNGGVISITTTFFSDNFYLSTDNGLTWSASSGVQTDDFFRASDGDLYHVQVSTILRSSDNGVTWQTINTTFPSSNGIGSLLELPDNRLLAITNTARLFESSDDGVSWIEKTIVSPDAPAKFALIYPNGELVGRSQFSLLRSTDDGITWSPSDKGIMQNKVENLVFFSDSIWMASTPNGIYRTNNGSGTWNRVYAFDNSPTNSNLFRHTAFWSADTFVWYDTNTSLKRTFDGGVTSIDISPPNFYGNSGNRMFVDTFSKRLFLNTGSGLRRSHDYGATWVSSGLSGVDFQQMVRHPNGDLYLSSSNGGIYKSTDTGTSWAQVTTIQSPENIRGVQISPTGTIYTLVLLSNNFWHLAFSSDNGQTWTYKPFPTTQDVVSSESFFQVNSSGQVFVVTVNNQIWHVFSTVNNGNSWFTLPSWEGLGVSSLLFLDQNDFLYGTNPYIGGMVRADLSAESSAGLFGSIRRDADADCTTQDAQEPLKRWKLEATGPFGLQYGSTGEDGTFQMSLPPGSYSLKAITPLNNLWWAFCDSIQTVVLDTPNASDTTDFIALALADCPLMAVDVTVPRLRRCFNNTVYVQTCNVGTETADSAWVDVELDPYLEFIYSNQPHDSVGPNTWRFFVGDVASGDCVQFNLTVYVNCDSTVLGQTHCITAHAFPDSLCTEVPNWSGANLEARVSCQDSVVHFELKNTGSVPSQPLDYIIIVDDVVLMEGEEMYDIAELVSFEQPANGQTWRIESQQEPGHPFSTVALAFAEGCGGFGSLGFVNQFSVNGTTPSVDRFCLENTGSYDPNDKQGFPRGYGDDNRIAPGQDLEYLIRFQNTGTDTAFTVRIVDTLSTWLDPASIVPGVSSHPYSWSLSGEGVITFLFENILLPDSNTNLAGSQGFVNFRIRQREQVPLNTVILNTAAIYFDFNTPIITNETRHTIGVDILNETHVPAKPITAEVSVLVSPNPATDEAVFRLLRGAFQGHRVLVTDAFGRVVHRGTANGDSYRWRVQGLPRGWYAWQVLDGKGKQVEAGKLVVE